jgi:conjugative relaxase-like TrwC/TraI family protein
MLRINEIANSAAAKAYYQAKNADYYIDGQELEAYWHGQAAPMLRLSGRVEKRAFDDLCDNLHPVRGQKLTAAKGERRVGYDFTFSVPKSVSVLHAIGGDERIADAFRVAVAATMGEVEREMKTRVRKRKADFDRPTGNMVWCDVVHNTSRPIGRYPDPQLHIHAVAFSLTWDDQEGQWKAGQFGDLKRDGSYFQAVFRSRLALELQALGYELKAKAGDFEVVGIPARVRGVQPTDGSDRQVSRLVGDHPAGDEGEAGGHVTGGEERGAVVGVATGPLGRAADERRAPSGTGHGRGSRPASGAGRPVCRGAHLRSQPPDGTPLGGGPAGGDDRGDAVRPHGRLARSRGS